MEIRPAEFQTQRVLMRDMPSAKGGGARKVNAGSYYSLYKYDYYSSLGERTNVRTYYVKCDYPFAQHYTLNGSYEFEQGLEDYQTAKLGMRYDF